MKNFNYFLLQTCIVGLLMMFFATGQTNAQTIWYVKPTATGNGSGNSWTNASSDLQAMINSALANDQIWVANGTYKPNRRADATATITPGDRDNAFVLKNNVKIYGGFAGTETSTDQRKVSLGRIGGACILSGDFNGNDGGNAQTGFTGMNENAYHVVISSYDIGAACLDGFTITGGNANGSSSILVNGNSFFQNTGGGMCNCNRVSSSPLLTNVTISGNNASSNGGGIYNSSSSSSPILINVIISGNNAQSGGGMCNSSSSPLLTNVIISGNEVSGEGGGMYNTSSSSPVLTNVTINGNNANDGGGGLMNNSSSPILTNVIIYGNSTSYNGGGMKNDYSSPILTNVSISGNMAIRGGGMYNYYSSYPIIRNSIIWNNGSSSNNIYNYVYLYIAYSYSLVDGVTDDTGGGLILAGKDPLFVDVTGGNLHLQAGSPCINVGSNTFFAAGQTPNLSSVTTDLDGNPRIVGSAIDLGAYEYPDATGILHVTSDNSSISVYPNPVSESFQINGIDKNTIVTLLDTSGKVVLRRAVAPDEKISVANLPLGIYIVCMADKTIKVIKQ